MLTEFRLSSSILQMYGFLTGEVAQLCGTQRVLGVKNALIFCVITAAMTWVQ